MCSLGRLRTAVGKYLGTKYCPELAFRYDTWTPHVEVKFVAREGVRVWVRVLVSYKQLPTVTTHATCLSEVESSYFRANVSLLVS